MRHGVRCVQIDGRTALIFAIEGSNPTTEVVGQLLDKGADVNAQDQVCGAAFDACAGNREGPLGGDSKDSGGDVYIDSDYFAYVCVCLCTWQREREREREREHVQVGSCIRLCTHLSVADLRARDVYLHLHTDLSLHLRIVCVRVIYICISASVFVNFNCL